MDLTYFKQLWCPELPRPELQNLLERSRIEELPDSLRQFCNDTSSILSTINDYVDDIVGKSCALSQNPNAPVSLKALCAHLGAHIQFHKNAIRNSRLQSAPSSIRGTLHLVPGKGWRITVGAPELPATRFNAAHEIAHILLYAYNKSDSVRLWHAGGWTVFEEAVVNYIARRILIPPSIAPLPTEAMNLARFVALEWQAGFKVPQEIATLRWLDENSSVADKTYAVLIAGQYDPFDRFFLLRATLRNHTLVARLSRLASHAKRRVPNISWERAISLWKWVFNVEVDDQTRLLWGNTFRENPGLVGIISELVAQIPDARRQDVVDSLTGADISKTFYYRWARWRYRPSLPCFVALARGTLKAGSQTANLAADLAVRKAATGLETLSIGALNGEFTSHAYATGDAAGGKRWIVQILESGTEGPSSFR